MILTGPTMFIELFESSSTEGQIAPRVGLNGRPQFDDLVLEFVITVLAGRLTAVTAHPRVDGVKGLVPLVGLLVRRGGGLGCFGVIESVQQAQKELS